MQHLLSVAVLLVRLSLSHPRGRSLHGAEIDAASVSARLQRNEGFPFRHPVRSSSLLTSIVYGGEGESTDCVGEGRARRGRRSSEDDGAATRGTGGLAGSVFGSATVVEQVEREQEASEKENESEKASECEMAA